MSDWLEDRALEERNRRLHGIEPGHVTRTQAAGKLIGDLFVGIIRWSIGLAALAVLVGLCFWGLVAIGNDKYILDCPGVVETRERVFIRNDSLHLDVTEYGGITKLWADTDGSAITATASGLFRFLELKEVGTALSLTGSSNEPGYYMPLTRIIELRVADGEWFRGKCTEREHR